MTPISNEPDRFEGIKLMISNLDQEVDYERIYEEFSKYGILLKVEMCESKSPIKTAYITYYSPLEAQTAMRALNGQVLVKNRLYVGVPLTHSRRRRSKTTYLKNSTGFDSMTNLNSSWSGRPKSEYNDVLQQPTDLSSSFNGSIDNNNNNTYFKTSGESLIDFKRSIANRYGAYSQQNR